MRELTGWTFRRRFGAAVCFSLLLHAFMLIVVWQESARFSETQSPLILTLWREPDAAPQKPTPPETPRRLVDAVNPAEEPTGPTDLIAEHNSRAHDTVEDEGSGNGPRVERVSDFDDPGSRGTRMFEPRAGGTKPKPAVKPTPVLGPKEKRAEPVEANGAGERMVVAHAADDGPPSASAAGPDAMTEAMPASGLSFRASRGRVGGGVKSLGFLGFDAMRSEVAPYLKEVRARVERQWHAALQLRYTGTSPTRAVVDCVIGPDGRLLEAVIVDAGNSPTYAPLCRAAIQQAAPFPPFPFKVPEIYQSKNLEIRWTFDFLM